MITARWTADVPMTKAGLRDAWEQMDRDDVPDDADMTITTRTNAAREPWKYKVAATWPLPQLPDVEGSAFLSQTDGRLHCPRCGRTSTRIDRVKVSDSGENSVAVTVGDGATIETRSDPRHPVWRGPHAITLVLDCEGCGVRTGVQFRQDKGEPADPEPVPVGSLVTDDHRFDVLAHVCCNTGSSFGDTEAAAACESVPDETASRITARAAEYQAEPCPTCRGTGRIYDHPDYADGRPCDECANRASDE